MTNPDQRPLAAARASLWHTNTKCKRGLLSLAALTCVGLLLPGCGSDEPPADRPRTILQGLTTQSTGQTEARSNQALGGREASNRARSESASDLSLSIRGTGTFTRPVGTNLPYESGDAGYTLNFEESDIGDVVQTIFGGILGMNYVLDPAAQGPITILTSSPVPRSDILPVIENILRARGFSVVRQNSVYHIVPTANASTSLLPIAPTGAYEAFGAVISPLKYVSASEMLEILKPFDKSNSILRVDTKRNLLILGGSQQERQTLLEVVRTFDVDWFEGMSFTLIPVQSSYATTLARDLEQVFGAEGSGLTNEVLRLVPIERINALLVISSQPQYIARVQDWVQRLDRDAQAIRRRLFIYYPQHVQASYLSSTIKSLFSSDPNQASENLQQDLLAPGLTPQVVSTTSDQPQNELVREAGNAALDIAGSDRSAVDEGLVLRNGVLIMADATKNALNIMATPSEYDQIINAITQLDTPPLQVLIEATIAEISLTDDLRYGFQYAFERGDSSLVLSEVSSGAAQAIFPGFSYVFAGNDIRAAFNALESITDINVLSSPHLLVVDSQTAELTVGDQVPVATQSVVSVTDPDAPTVNSIEFRDTGVVLKVTPKVNASGVVNLEIEQEVSDVVSTTTSGIDSPTIQQRKVKSTIMVRDGDTVVLGGLIRENQTESSSGIPILSSLPVVGALFGTQSNNVDRTELLIVITPRVVDNHDTLKAISREIQEKIGNISLE